MDFKTLEPQVRAAFHESMIQNLKIEKLRKFITIPRPTLASSGFEEYTDYMNVTDIDAVEKARILGAGCAILYNAILSNALHVHKHNVVVDLLENENLKFNFVMNSEPSVADPMGLIPGWISFRFVFASSNVASSLVKGKTLLAAESAHAL